MFGFTVALYVLSTIGISVFIHYCGGELENVTYVIKGKSCCGINEDESEAKNNGCCKDENYILKNTVDFTIKNIKNHDFLKTCCDLFYTTLPFSNFSIKRELTESNINKEFPPPKLQNSLVISCTVLRI